MDGSDSCTAALRAASLRRCVRRSAVRRGSPTIEEGEETKERGGAGARLAGASSKLKQHWDANNAGASVVLPEPPSQWTSSQFWDKADRGTVPGIIVPLVTFFGALLDADTAASEAAAAAPPCGGNAAAFDALVDAADKPCAQLRVAHAQYILRCVASLGAAQPRIVEEFTWVLVGVSPPDQARLTQLTLCTAAGTTPLRNAMAPLLLHVAGRFGRSVVSAGRTSIEMALVGDSLSFTIDKTTAAELLDLHAHHIVGGPGARRGKRGPLVILDMDGTIARKDAQHGNTVDNNLSRSRAIVAIKACLRGNNRCPPGIVAVNTGNKALLQVQRLLAAFGGDDTDVLLLRRVVLVAQGGTVAYRFVPSGVAGGSRAPGGGAQPGEVRKYTVHVERVEEWEGWHETLEADSARVQGGVARAGGADPNRPLYVDDELGGNESRYGHQIQVHVPSMSGSLPPSEVRLHDKRNIVEAGLPQDRGTGAAILSFLELQALTGSTGQGVSASLHAASMRAAHHRDAMSSRSPARGVGGKRVGEGGVGTVGTVGTVGIVPLLRVQSQQVTRNHQYGRDERYTGGRGVRVGGGGGGGAGTGGQDWTGERSSGVVQGGEPAGAWRGGGWCGGESGDRSKDDSTLFPSPVALRMAVSTSTGKADRAGGRAGRAGGAGRAGRAGY